MTNNEKKPLDLRIERRDLPGGIVRFAVLNGKGLIDGTYPSRAAAKRDVARWKALGKVPDPLEPDFVIDNLDPATIGEAVRYANKDRLGRRKGGKGAGKIQQEKKEAWMLIAGPRIGFIVALNPDLSPEKVAATVIYGDSSIVPWPPREVSPPGARSVGNYVRDLRKRGVLASPQRKI
jgi:hypothetical protein